MNTTNLLNPTGSADIGLEPTPQTSPVSASHDQSSTRSAQRKWLRMGLIVTVLFITAVMVYQTAITLGELSSVMNDIGKILNAGV
jgi:hypothetical protein